jgi:hypothetical protein
VPSVSKKQHNLMAAVANNPAFAKKVGIPQSVGRDFSEADKGRKFAKGGDMAKKLFGGKETYAEELKEAKAIKSGRISPQQYARGEQKEEAGMKMKKMAAGGMAAGKMGKVVAGGKRPHGEHTVQQKGHTKGTMVKMKRGGKC